MANTTPSPAAEFAVRGSTSQLVQALESKGLGKGSRIAVISANRPEVLSNIAAMQIAGCIGTPLHPLGSLDDHAYVLEAAEIDTLVYDSSVFEEVAAALKQKVPGLKNLLAFGPTEVGEDYLALAAGFEPQPLVAPDVGHCLYDSDPDGRVGVPRGTAHAHRHSPVPRGGGFFHSRATARWRFLRDAGIFPRRVF